MDLLMLVEDWEWCPSAAAVLPPPLPSAILLFAAELMLSISIESSLSSIPRGAESLDEGCVIVSHCWFGGAARLPPPPFCCRIPTHNKFGTRSARPQQAVCTNKLGTTAVWVIDGGSGWQVAAKVSKLRNVPTYRPRPCESLFFLPQFCRLWSNENN